jgi:toluene monooxygenase system protein D
VTRASLQRNLGEAFEMRQLEAMMSAFAGRIATSSDEVTWSLTAGAPDAPAKEDAK